MQLLAIFIGVTIFFHQAVLIQTQSLDIVQTAMGNSDFKTLVTALEAANLTMALKGTGPFTVFAPTDAAFNKLPDATLANLMKPENKGRLTEILGYHVINGQSLTSAQINAMTLPAQIVTLEGQSINVSKNGNDLEVNNAKVITADVMASNGIIHAIDTVLMPAATDSPTIPTTSSATYVSRNEPLFFVLTCTVLFSFFTLPK